MPALRLTPLPRMGYLRKLDAGLAGVAGLLLATYVVTSFTVARPEDGIHLLLDGYLSNVVLLLITASAGLRAALAARLRGPHVALALAIACWTAGDLLWTIVVRNLDPEPWPSVADGFYLGFYPLAVVALIAFMRHQAGAARLGLWLDGLVGGLAMAALGSALFLQPIINASSGSPTAIAVNLAYPLADLLLLLLVVGGITVIGRIGWWWTTLGLGLCGFAVGDTVYLFQVANESYNGGAVDLSWIVALAVLGLVLPRVPLPERRSADRSKVTLLLPIMFSVLALVLIAGHEWLNTEGPSFALAVGALATAIPRLVVGGRELRMLQATHHQARTDELTGLANRRALNEALPALVGAATAGSPLDMLIIDLDGFKHVNDSLGHDVGDRLLVHLAGRLRTSLDPDDLLVRLGGDEFAILRQRPRARLDTDSLAAAITRAIAEPVRIDAATVSVRASIGIARAPDQACTPSTLFRKADAAMYSAKRSRLGYARFDDSQDETAQLRSELATKLATGLDPEQFRVYYQPVMDLTHGQVSGVEALIRWHHPTLGVLAPVTFLGLINELGANHAITDLVLDQALAAAADWQRRISLDFTVAVNITSADVQDHDFTRRVATLIARHRVNPNSVILEVTESTLLSDVSAATATLQGLRNLGLRIALDDFGTGYSSLSHLRDLPIDQLKLDRSFITDLEHDPVSEAIIRSVVGLAALLNLGLVAEGIEQESTAKAVALIGCDHAQGFLWSRALTATDFDAWRRQQESERCQLSSAFLKPLMAPL